MSDFFLPVSILCLFPATQAPDRVFSIFDSVLRCLARVSTLLFLPASRFFAVPSGPSPFFSKGLPCVCFSFYCSCREDIFFLLRFFFPPSLHSPFFSVVFTGLESWTPQTTPPHVSYPCYFRNPPFNPPNIVLRSPQRRSRTHNKTTHGLVPLPSTFLTISRPRLLFPHPFYAAFLPPPLNPLCIVPTTTSSS